MKQALILSSLFVSALAFAATQSDWKSSAEDKIADLDYSTDGVELELETERTAVYTKLFAEDENLGDLRTCHVAVFVNKNDASIIAPSEDSEALEMLNTVFSYGDERVDNVQEYVLICAD